MSDSGHELLNMPAGGEGKKRGCCRRHPVACGVTLLVVGVVSLGVVGAALGIRPYLNKTFTDTVDKVCDGFIYSFTLVSRWRVRALYIT